MNFESAQTTYLDHLRIERGLSQNTTSSYTRDLLKFADFLREGSKDFTLLVGSDLTDFEVWLKGQKLALSSINRTLSAVKGLYKYLQLEYEMSNPTLDLVSAKLARKLPKALSVQEITLLIESSKREGDLNSLRDFAILELLY